jgi:hypothetical protein
VNRVKSLRRSPDIQHGDGAVLITLHVIHDTVCWSEGSTLAMKKE